MDTLHNTKAGKIFDIFNALFLALIGLFMVIPFIYVIAGSFATELELTTRSFFLWPNEISLDSYRFIFSTNTFIRSLLVTVGVTIVGTLVQLFCTFTFAYPLSRKHLKGRNTLLNLVIFAMLFSGGMIPTFIVVKNLGLINSYWALILSIAINPFNLMIIKNFFQEMPIELEESAKMDGCTELGILW